MPEGAPAPTSPGVRLGRARGAAVLRPLDPGVPVGGVARPGDGEDRLGKEWLLFVLEAAVAFVEDADHLTRLPA